MSKIERIGIRLYKSGDGTTPLIARCAEVYNLDTGEFLPAQSVDIHLDTNSFVSATIVLDINEVQVVENEV